MQGMQVVMLSLEIDLFFNLEYFKDMRIKIFLQYAIFVVTKTYMQKIDLYKIDYN